MSELSEAILRLKAEGKTYNQIKAELGCSKGTISYYLGVGQRDKQLNRTRVRRTKVRAHIQEVKNGTPCADCGEMYPYWIMEFDHLDPSAKIFNISRTARATSMEVLKAEIAKCDIVCSNCHKNRTHYRLVQHTEQAMEDLYEIFK